MRIGALAAGFTLAFATFAGAHAATETVTFSGPTNFGTFSGSAVLDVQNGVAVSGTGSITGTDLGRQTLDLITTQTPGAEVASDGTVGYRSNHGDDFGGFDDIASSDLLFALGPNAPAPNGNLIFGIYDGNAGTVDSGFFGNSANGTRFYEYNTSGATFAVSAVPEPSTWALMILGIGGIGLAFRQAKSKHGFRFKDAFAA